MKTIRYTQKKEIREVIDRPAVDLEDAFSSAKKIMGEVKKKGDAALFEYTKKFDGFLLTEKNIKVTDKEIDAATARLDPSLLKALKHAAKNIKKFQGEQLKKIDKKWYVEIEDGVWVGEKTTAIDAVGCYVPGGRASYASTVLMNCIPAKVAGCQRVVVVSPPPVSDAVLAAAGLCGADEVYRVGGAQAVAALTYGTESIAKVDKIVGPGNKYVLAAKTLAYGKAGVDMPAGPSEVLILADETADPRLVAADVLAQAEHDPDARCVVATDSKKIAEQTEEEIRKQLYGLSTRKTAEESLRNMTFVLTENQEEAVEFANEYAAEHLEVMTREPAKTAERIRNAGAIFLGPWSPVAAGDYCSGGNHVLPTSGAARYSSELSVRDFLKTTGLQKITRDGIKRLGKTISELAGSEGFDAHRKSAEKRYR